MPALEYTRKPHISFDLDGTLVDSLPLMQRAWEHTQADLNFKIDWADYQAQLGLRFSTICKNLGIEHIKDEVESTYFGFCAAQLHTIRLCRGVATALNSLQKAEVPWSIITSRKRDTSLEILDQLKLQPHLLITIDDVANSKPDVESALLLKSQLKTSSQVHYYIGDSVVDEKFSTNAGFRFFRFSQSRTPTETTLQAYNHQHGNVYNDMDLIVQRIFALNKIAP